MYRISLDLSRRTLIALATFTAICVLMLASASNANAVGRSISISSYISGVNSFQTVTCRLSVESYPTTTTVVVTTRLSCPFAWDGTNITAIDQSSGRYTPAYCQSTNYCQATVSIPKRAGYFNYCYVGDLYNIGMVQFGYPSGVVRECRAYVR
jgi:hypothetical protein